MLRRSPVAAIPTLALLAWLAAAPAHAGASDGAIGPTFLSWSGCSGASPSSIPFDCQPEGGSVYTIVGSFALSEAIDHAVSMDVNLDVVFPTLTTIPDFWNVGADGCSPQSLMLVRTAPSDCDGAGNAFCSGDSTLCDMLYTTIVASGPGRLRIAITLSRAEPGGVPLAALPERYFAFAINVPMTHAQTCGGCVAPARLIWSNGTIYSLDDLGLPRAPVTVDADYSGAGACAVVNTDASNCGTSPVLRTTWGRLKSLYR